MKLELNIEKKHFWIITSILMLGLGAMFASGAWDPAKSVWHSGNDVKVIYKGVDSSVQEAVTDISNNLTQVNNNINALGTTETCPCGTCWNVVYDNAGGCGLATYNLCTPSGNKVTGAEQVYGTCP